MRKGFSAIFVLGLILAVSVFIGVFFLKGRGNRVGNVSTTNLASPHASAIPLLSEEPVPTAPLNFVEVDFKKYEDEFHIKLNSISSGLVKPVSCLSDGSDNTNFTNLKNRIPSDPIIVKAAEVIENYKFSDEWSYWDQKEGKEVFVNKGQSSTREIGYHKICRSNGNYYLTFETTGPTVRGCGGCSPPDYFAWL